MIAPSPPATSGDNLQDLFHPPPPPSSPPQSSSSTQNSFHSSSSTSVEEWINRILTHPTASEASSYSTTSGIFTSTYSKKRKRDSCLDGDELIEPHTLVPLKRENLQRHSTAMTPPPIFQTPNKSGADTPIDRRAASWVRACLEGHNIFYEHKVFEREDYKDFKQLVLAIFEGDRHSAVKPDSAQKYTQVYDYYKDLNEASFKTEILPLIVKRDFEILVEPATDTSAAVYESSDSWHKGLRVQYNQSVNRGHIPHTYTDPRFDPRKIKDALTKEGILNAEPDAVWGFDPSSMPDFQFHPDTRELMLLVPKLNWPFFVIQSKQANGNFDEACNEACREGIAIISAARELCERAGIYIQTPGPDQNTYIYSAVMDTKVMEWFVHWAEVANDGIVRYHMNQVVGSRVLKGEKKALGDLRSPTHSILEWGLGTRKPMVEGWYKAIANHSKGLLMKKSASGSTTGSKRSYTESSGA